MNKDELIIIGQAEKIDFPEIELKAVPARVDTGAKTSSIWATSVKEADGELRFKLFGKSSEFYTGQEIRVKSYSRRMVASSNGALEDRYVVRLLVSFFGKKIRASFTLANRSTQVYPILVGRNILKGKFIVDVDKGVVLGRKERQRARELKLELERLDSK